ncbi:hypothetical protein HK405_001410, partial [Cladochytrium tenue]
LVVTSTSSNMSLKMLHGMTMYIAFAFVYPTGVFVARYFNVGRWLLIHQTLMGMVASNVFVAALTAFVGSYGDATFMHYKVGMVNVGLIALSTAMGYLSVRTVSPRMATVYNIARFLHRMLGVVSYVLGLYNGYLGVDDLTAGMTYNVGMTRAYLATVGICPVALFIYGEFIMPAEVAKKKSAGAARLTTTGSKQGGSQVDPASKVPEFTWEEVNLRVSLGAKWIVIDGNIHDIEQFLYNHPGGSKNLVRLMGLDATRYFHGH